MAGGVFQTSIGLGPVTSTNPKIWWSGFGAKPSFAAGGPPPGDHCFLLLELGAGNFLLQEDSSRIKLETCEGPVAVFVTSDTGEDLTNDDGTQRLTTS